MSTVNRRLREVGLIGRVARKRPKTKLLNILKKFLYFFYYNKAHLKVAQTFA